MDSLVGLFHLKHGEKLVSNVKESFLTTTFSRVLNGLFASSRHVLIAIKVTVPLVFVSAMFSSVQRTSPIPSGCSAKAEKEGRTWETYDVKLQEVSEARGAVHPHQDGVLQVRAEANG